MATFGLVHGAWHGAWCWERLVGELEARGHRAVAVDLPAEDPDAGLERYAELTSDRLADAEDVVLVGHSLGAMSAPLAATLRPVRHLVFLCGLVPDGNRSVTELYTEEDVFLPGFAGNTAIRESDGASYWPDPEAAKRCFYDDCSPADAEWAVAQMRPQSKRPRSEPFPLERLPDVERSSIIGRDERAVSPDWSRRVARERLGVECIELDGGHSPFVARPGDLAALLHRLAPR